MTKYFLITGFDEGKFIEPYIVKTDGELPYIITHPPYGDKARYYEKLTLSEAIKKSKEGIKLYE